MDKGYEKQRFESLSIKTSVAKKFRSFCKKISESQSMALLHMINFFENNGVTPHDDLDATIASLKGQMGKRFNAVIAIIKNIERDQTKPTSIMLQSLLEETNSLQKEEAETHAFGKPELISENEELIYYRNKYDIHKQELLAIKQQMETVVEKTSYVKSNFGSGYFRLDLTKDEFENLKQQLNDVHHYNTSKTGR